MEITYLPDRKIISYKGDILTSPADVKGYDGLSPDQQILFDKFLNNFYQVWEFPEKHCPVKIRYVADKTPYLRVDFADDEWLHILSPTVWF